VEIECTAFEIQRFNCFSLCLYYNANTIKVTICGKVNVISFDEFVIVVVASAGAFVVIVVVVLSSLSSSFSSSF